MKNILLSILIFCNVSFIIINYKQKKNCENISTKLIIKYETLFNDYKGFIHKTYKYENVELNTNDSTSKILCSYIDKYGTLLIYRIPFPYCESCIMPTLKQLKEFTHENQIDNILIITSFLDIKAYNKFRQEIDTNKFNYLNISEIDLNINSKESEGSYTFILQQSMKPLSLFFNSKFNNQIFASYLNSIKNKLQ